MTFTVPRTELLTALSITGKAVSKNGIIPILSGYLFELRKGVLTISGCDQENSITYTMPCTGDKLNIAIPANLLYNTVKELPEQPLLFTVSGNVIEIKAAKGKYKIPFDPGIDFPKLAHNADQVFHVNTEYLFANIQKTVFAAANNHIIAGLNYMLLKIGKDSTTLVASNGMIMSVRYLDMPGKSSELLFTPQSLNILTSLPYNEQCTLSISKTSARCIVNDNTVFTCLLSGEKFPDFERILPTENDKSLSVDAQELTGALKRLQLFASEANNDFVISMGSRVVSASSENLKSDHAEEEISGTYSGDPLDVKLKCGMILALLGRIDTESIELTFSEHNKGVVINQPGSDNKMFIMPIV